MNKAMLMLIPLLSLWGCGDAEETTASKSGDKSAAGAGGASGSAAGPVASGPVKIEQLGLTIDAPGDAVVKDAIGGNGVQIQGGDLFVHVGLPGKFDKATLTEVIEEEKSSKSAENLVPEELDDGWALSFTNTGGLGTNYWVDVRRTFGDVTYRCDTSASTQAQQDAALAACKSLRKE